MKKQKEHYFYLLRNEEGPDRVPATKRISATAQVILNGESDVTKIRYAKGIRSIKEEEQGNVPAKMLDKPTFVKGVLVVKPHEKVLLEYLRNHPCNQNCEATPVYGERKTFFEFKPEEVARQDYERMEGEFNFYDSVFQLSYEKQIKPMCFLAGIDTEDETYIVKRNFVYWAKNNQDLYEDWLDKEFYVQRTRDVIDALDTGIIRIESQTVKMLPNTELVSFPSGSNVIESFVNWTYEDGMEKWKTVYKMLQAKLNRTHDKTHGDKDIANNPLFEELSVMNSEELFERAKDEGVVDWQPPYFMFKGKRLGKGKDASTKQLDNNRNMRRNITLAIVNKDNAENVKED